MPLDGCRRFGAIEFERHDNHEKTIQLYPGTVRVREAFVLRSIEVYPWFNDLVTAVYFLSSVEVQLDLVTVVLLSPPVSNIHSKGHLHLGSNNGQKPAAP